MFIYAAKAAEWLGVAVASSKLFCRILHIANSQRTPSVNPCWPRFSVPPSFRAKQFQLSIRGTAVFFPGSIPTWIPKVDFITERRISECCSNLSDCQQKIVPGDGGFSG